MADPSRATVNHAAVVLGVNWRRAKKVLDRLAFAYPAAADGTYDARVLDLLRALRGQPHRALEPVESDWLARYLGDLHDAAQAPRQGPQEP